MNTHTHLISSLEYDSGRSHGLHAEPRELDSLAYRAGYRDGIRDRDERKAPRSPRSQRLIGKAVV